MARKDAQPGLKEAAAERRLKAFRLRAAGMIYRDIAAQLNISDKTAHQDVQRVMAEYHAQALSNAAEYVALEEARLDMALVALAPKLKYGDPAVVNAWVKISESRRRLLGLDMQPGTELPAELNIILRWHDDNRHIIDATPVDDHPAPAPQIAADSSAEPGALSYRVRWSEMGQVETGGDAEPENGA